ncbi:MAG: redoxin family protein [Cryobacterium sp.]|nr:redoxin family protein [Oligoflexia bacterium]
MAGIPPSLSGADIGQKSEESSLVKKDLKDAKATVVVFLSAKCPCSASHESSLRSLATEYGAKGFQFIGIHSNRDETAEFAKAHFQSLHLPFPVIEDGQANETPPLATAYGALKTPHAFVVSPSGEILYSGGVDDSKDATRATKLFLKDALIAVATGKKPEVTESRTLGCVIQRTPR